MQKPQQDENNKQQLSLQSMVETKLHELLDLMSLHLATAKTQKDLELPIQTLIISTIQEILSKDLKLLKHQDELGTGQQHNQHYNWMIAQLCCKELESFVNANELSGIDARSVRKQVFKGAIKQICEEVRFSIGKLMAQQTDEQFLQMAQGLIE